MQDLLYKKGNAMKALNISEARNTLPALVEAVSATRVPVVLLRYGKPAAMLVPIERKTVQANPYPLRDVPISLAEDFDAPIPELWAACKVAEEAETYGAADQRPRKAKRKEKRE